MTTVKARPILKWPGGKTQLLQHLRTRYPEGTIGTYVEPFIGGGAVLFDILSTREIGNAVINDINPNLVNVYRTVQQRPEELIARLRSIQENYLSSDTVGRADKFYEYRSEFNQNLAEYTEPNVDQAALLIFLNKTCFNGLYRVNRSGAFNSPHGRYASPLICDEENLKAVSEVLQRVTILNGDYRGTLPHISDKTFLYLDPPYRPLTKTASFNAYDSSVFDDTAQRELADFITESHNRGAKILLSNSDPKNADEEDEFFDELYAQYTITRVPARRAISSKASTRGKINEILVTNY